LIAADRHESLKALHIKALCDQGSVRLTRFSPPRSL
jgi:hypothetical protein